jgi:epsilon-lactone hydrolase
VNQTLNLNLGQKLLDPENKTLLWIARFLDKVLIGWWEDYLYVLWKIVPLQWKRNVTFFLWKLVLPLHKRFLGRRTGIHSDASEEYHCLSTLMWASRLFPVSIKRMRFSLSQLSVATPTPTLARIEPIDEPCMLSASPPDAQRDQCRIDGLYVHVSDEPTEYALFWVYGGAFLSGDVHGNLSPAERIGREAGMDVFLGTHRLVPEAKMSDILWDICLTYRWFCQRRIRQGKDPAKVFLLGISSGGGLVVRLLQSISECTRGQVTLPEYLSAAIGNKDISPMPRGAVLLGPFADYTVPKGSFLHYPRHDLIVNQRVMESGIPYLETHCDGGRYECSPVHRSFEGGLPPLCVIASQHEAIYDHAIDLVNKARAAGIPVTLGVWQYMCHVFPFFSSFIPEGEQAMKFVSDWLQQQKQQENE